ncbi:MAG: hypothetical protein HY000_36745 [Planctomycetes bacterium]|nr:hypothetical protein [Planctomycetota bacterium]
MVVRIASVERVLGNANDLIAALGPAAAAAAPFAEQAIGGLLNVGAGLGAVERAAPAYVAVLSLTEPPQPAFLVRSPDEVKLRRAVLVAGENDTLKTEKRNDGFERVAKDETSWFFGRCGEWVLYTPSEQVVKLLAFDREKEKTFGSVVERHCVELLDAGDLSAAVNVAKLTETFKNEIEQARQQVLQGIEQLPDEQLSTGGADPRAIKKLYSDLATLAFDTLRDTRWAAGRLNFDAEGVRAEGALSVAEGSGTDALLAANPPSTLEHLGLLPAGAPAYAGMNFNSEQVTTWLRDWLSAAFATDEKKKEAIQAALEGFAKAGLGQIAGSFSLPAGPNTGMLVTMLFEAQDPNALRTAFRDYSVQLGESKNPMFTQTVEYTAAAETYKDHPVDLMLQGLQFNAQDPQLAIVQGLLTRFFGGAKFQTRLTTLEGMLVEATGNDPKFLHQLVDSLE